MSGATVVFSRVVKAYGGLRPLRVRHLQVAGGEVVAVGGLDATAAQVLTDLALGTTLPDEGEIHLFDRRTADVQDEKEWLALVDRCGIISERVVLLESYSVLQNVAIPLTLSIDPLDPAVVDQAMGLSVEAGIPRGELDRRVAEASPALRLRVKLARAAAHGPQLLMLEHPTASLGEEERDAFAHDLRALLTRRAAAALVVTTDPALAAGLQTTLRMHQPASGEFTQVARPLSQLRRLFSRRG